MTEGHQPVRERQAMLAGMTPALADGIYHFCSTTDADIVRVVLDRSLAMFREEEGTALVLEAEDAARYGFDLSMPMARIVLQVFSALDGVGLTAGVAGALADHGIPCNMIAAYHHDNVFVPLAMEAQALAVLQDLQRRSESP